MTVSQINSTPFRVAILTSRCGGHEMVAESVKKAIQDKFPQAILVEDKKRKGEEHLADLLWPLGAKGATFYKKAVEGQWFRTIPIASALGLEFMKLNDLSLKKSLNQFMGEKKPDIIISVVPLINAPLLKAAAAKGIPVLIIPTDADNAFYSHNWPSPKTKLAPHRYTLPYSCLEIASRIHQDVDKKLVQAIGYGVRPEFDREFSSAEKIKIRQKLKIPADKKIFLLMLGGSFGSNANYEYVKSILTNQQTIAPAHYAVFCGRQASMQGKLKKLLLKHGYIEQANGQFAKRNSGATFSILGFTNNVHEYMGIAHCICTKPGSGTFNEAIFQKVPILFDATNGHMPWEGLNIDIAEQYGLGQKVSSHDQIPKFINAMMKPETHQKYVESLAAFRKARPNQFKFAENVQNLTAELLCEAQQAREEGRIPIPPPAPTILSTAKKIALFLWKVILFPIFLIKKLFLEWIPHRIVQLGFFSAFIRTQIAQKSIFKCLCPNKATLESRRREMIEHGATPIEGVISGTNTFLDAIRIPAKNNPDKKTVVFVLSKHYQNLHPRKYNYMLDEGWDVVFFNPSRSTSVAMNEDLKALTRRLREEHPGAKIAFNGYCIGAHIAPAAAAELVAEAPQEPPIGLIVDRGFGDANIATENFISLAKIPAFKKTISAEYNLRTADKVKNYAGDVLFLSPKDGQDRLMHTRKGNLSKEFFEKFPLEKRRWRTIPDVWNQEKQKWERATHWSSWDQETQNHVADFLRNFFNGEPQPKVQEAYGLNKNRSPHRMAAMASRISLSTAQSIAITS